MFKFNEKSLNIYVYMYFILKKDQDIRVKMFFLGNISVCKLFICERKLNVLNIKYKNLL